MVWKKQHDTPPWNGEPWRSPSGLLFNNRPDWLVEYLHGITNAGFVLIPHPKYLRSDIAGTVPLTGDGDRVGVWFNALGTGKFTALSLNERPFYRTDGSSHWVEFTGTQRMQNRDMVRAGAELKEGWALLASLRQTGSSSLRGIMGSMSGTSLRVYLSTATGGQFQVGAGSGHSSNFGSSIRTGDIHVLGGIDDGTRWVRRINGIQSNALTRSYGTGIATGFGLGYADGVGNSNFQGSLYGAVYATTVLSLEQIERIETHLGYLAI